MGEGRGGPGEETRCSERCSISAASTTAHDGITSCALCRLAVEGHLAQVTVDEADASHRAKVPLLLLNCDLDGERAMYDYNHQNQSSCRELHSVRAL